MALKLIKNIKPDSYAHSVYDINYSKLYENGIRYAVFDLDCTLLPFDDIRVKEEDEVLFNYINLTGIKAAICSSGLNKRVKPVADRLGVNYIARAKKPWVKFDDIKKLFDYKCKEDNTMFVGDSLYLDMLQAHNINVYKVLVDMVRDGFNFKLAANDVIQAVMYFALQKEGFKYNNYYKGYKER